MIFADMSNGEAGAIGGMLGGIPAIIAAVAFYFRGKRKDAMTEWQQTVRDLRQELHDCDASHQKEIAELRRQYNADTLELRSEIFDLRKKEREGYTREMEYKAELRLAQSNLRRLQASAHDTAPGITLPVEITADENGVIYWASAGVGPMFHWLPQQLMKQKIAVLMPARLQPLHAAGLAKLIADGREPDPEKPVLTYGLTKDGDEFPITVNLCGWIGQAGKRYINAEIRRRATGDSGVVQLHGPKPEPKKD